MALGSIMARAMVAQSMKAIGTVFANGERPPNRQICARPADHRSPPFMSRWMLQPAIRRAKPIALHNSRTG